MASFHAELEVAGRRYHVWNCSYEFTQATAVRGTAAGKVRHGLVHVELDVPDDDTLLDWAAAPTKPLPGHVYFTDAQGAALETLSWATGECVGYREDFAAHHDGRSAYRCWLTIAAAHLSLAPGLPAAAAPQQAFQNSPWGPVLGPAAARAGQEITKVAPRLLGGAARVAGAAIGTLGLVLTPTNDPDAPGYDAEKNFQRNHPIPLPDPDALRLAELEARHAQGTLAPGEEAEMLRLLAKVKGIHVNSLADLAATGPLPTGPAPVPTVGPDYEGLVPMEHSDLGRMALEFRKAKPAGNWHPGNVAVFEYEGANGQVKHLVQETNPTVTKRHAERLALEKLRSEGVAPDKVRRIYSELEPCETPDGGLKAEGCKVMLLREYPKAKVTYSYEYRGSGADTRSQRAASIERRSNDFKKYQK